MTKGQCLQPGHANGSALDVILMSCICVDDTMASCLIFLPVNLLNLMFYDFYFRLLFLSATLGKSNNSLCINRTYDSGLESLE